MFFLEKLAMIPVFLSHTRTSPERVWFNNFELHLAVQLFSQAEAASAAIFTS